MNNDQITLRLKASCKRPLYLFRVEYVDILIHYEDVLDIETVGKGGKDGIFALSFHVLFDRDDRMVATRAARGHVHRPDGRYRLTHHLEQTGLARDTTEQQMLVAGRNDRVEYRVVTV